MATTIHAGVQQGRLPEQRPDITLKIWELDPWIPRSKPPPPHRLHRPAAENKLRSHDPSPGPPPQRPLAASSGRRPPAAPTVLERHQEAWRNEPHSLRKRSLPPPRPERLRQRPRGPAGGSRAGSRPGVAWGQHGDACCFFSESPRQKPFMVFFECGFFAEVSQEQVKCHGSRRKLLSCKQNGC
jgi:hypothetical protein